MKKRLPLLLFLIVSSTLFINAQQNNIWYLGRQAGLDFNLTGSQTVPVALQNSAMITDEGCSTISDATGSLLFYTNGVTVYNKAHSIMVNGDALAGHPSACQSGLIVQQPGSDNLFYIFTTDGIEGNFTKGYNYSIVDMNMQGGNGEVIVKNQLLWQSCTERVTAVRHSNGVDVWLITNDNNSNIFRSWLITCSGLQPTAVVSTAGIILNYSVLTNTGYMKVSPDGKQLCQTHFPLEEVIGGVSNFIQLFDFDNTTGQISNGKSVTTPNSLYIGCEYSPDSRFLYITRPGARKIDQIEAKLTTVAAIEASVVSIPTVGNPFGIQLGPDEKIYVFKQSLTVGVINSPNVKAPNVSFNETQISTAPHTAYLSSPSFINDVAYDASNTFNYSLVGTCNGEVQFNSFTSMPGTITWDWDFGDGTTSALQNPVHTFVPDDKLYNVTLTMTSSLSCARIRRSRFVKPGGIFGAADYEFLIRCDSNYVRFTNTSKELLENNVQFIWDFGDGTTSTDLNPIHTFSTPGKYDVKLSTVSVGTCSGKEVTKEVDIEQFEISASPTVATILIGETVFLSAAGPVADYKWSPSRWLVDSASKNVVATPLQDIVYKVTATDSEGCSAEDSVIIKVIQYNDIYIPTAFTPNNDGRNDQLKPYFPGTILLKDFSIFNRWGNRIFTTSQRGFGWDGKVNGEFQPAGVYVWSFQAFDEKTQKSVIRKGVVTLIR